MTSPDSPQPDFGQTLALLEAARDGDSGALDALADRCLPRIRQIVALRLGWRLRQFVELDDVVQDVVIRMIRGIHDFETRSHGAFHNWLARCVENEIRDQARHFDRQRRGANKVRRFGDYATTVLRSSIFAGNEPTPSQYANAEETAERIEEVLLEMPEHLRELIILRAVCGMSPSETAAELGIPNERVVRVAYSRAMKKLKEKIERS